MFSTEVGGVHSNTGHMEVFLILRIAALILIKELHILYKMAQWIKHLPSKHENLSSEPHDPH